MAASPPVVMPLFSSAPPTRPTSGRANSSNWNEAAIQKHTPATAIFSWLCSFWMTVRAPSTKSAPVTMIR